jgi:hypothetical protein
VHADVVRADPLDICPDVREQGEHRVDVADARHVVQDHRLAREDARGENR